MTEPKFEKDPNTLLADKLDEMQASKNDGRGVSCIGTIITFLRMGDIDKAKAVCFNEGDKIRNYPDIEDILKKELFAEDNDTPWSALDRLKK